MVVRFGAQDWKQEPTPVTLSPLTVALDIAKIISLDITASEQITIANLRQEERSNSLKITERVLFIARRQRKVNTSAKGIWNHRLTPK